MNLETLLKYSPQYRRRYNASHPFFFPSPGWLADPAVKCLLWNRKSLLRLSQCIVCEHSYLGMLLSGTKYICVLSFFDCFSFMCFKSVLLC